jgi:alkanesulfonate monooxygenase SsuD/methylene tetrahydromethanopterin reductase-like flavin-dependent oxidoreductase (luciferase family)
MKFGLFGGALGQTDGTGDSRYYEEFIDYVVDAEDLGFHSVFVVEHHFTGINQISSTITLLAHLAARTSRIRLGTGVTVLPWHNPVLLAEQIATLDLLSGGRTDVGVGKGYRPYEFKGFDIPPEEAGERYEEALELMIQCWTSRERFSHKSARWTFNDIIVEPKVTQRPHPPIWVGASGEESILRAARQSFNILLDQWSPVGVLESRMATYASALSAGSFHPGRVGVTRAVQLTATAAERETLLQGRTRFVIDSGALASPKARMTFGIDEAACGDLNAAARTLAFDSSLVGDAGEVIGKLRELQDAGVEYVLLAELSTSRDALRAFAREVMPEFTDKSAL